MVEAVCSQPEQGRVGACVLPHSTPAAPQLAFAPTDLPLSAGSTLTGPTRSSDLTLAFELPGLEVSLVSAATGSLADWCCGPTISHGRPCMAGLLMQAGLATQLVACRSFSQLLQCPIRWTTRRASCCCCPPRSSRPAWCWAATPPQVGCLEGSNSSTLQEVPAAVSNAQRG